MAFAIYTLFVSLFVALLTMAALSEFDRLPTSGLPRVCVDRFRARNGAWLEWTCRIDASGALVGCTFISAPTVHAQPVEVLPALQVHKLGRMAVYSPLRAPQVVDCRGILSTIVNR